MNYADLNQKIASVQSPEEYIDRECVKHLNRICEETGAGIVITSHWRLTKTVNEMQKVLEKFGFTGKIVGKTRKTAIGVGYEINLWYYNHKDIADYIVLDSDIIDYEAVNSFQIKTNFNGKGLTARHADMAIEMLRKDR